MAPGLATGLRMAAPWQEAAIETAAARLNLTEPILMGWSSGGAMASAFLGYANEHGFVTAGGRSGTRYTVRGLVLLMAGSQFCYAYHSRCPKGSNQQRVCAAEVRHAREMLTFTRRCLSQVRSPSECSSVGASCVHAACPATQLLAVEGLQRVEAALRHPLRVRCHSGLVIAQASPTVYQKTKNSIYLTILAIAPSWDLAVLLCATAVGSVAGDRS